MSQVHLIDHPLIQHKLTLMRRKEASTNGFRRMLGELSTLMAYEITRDMPLQDIEIETPMETMTGKVIDGKKLVLVSILRAGNGFLDGMLNVVPGARIGHIGLYRDPATLQPVEYYFKMPSEMEERDIIVVDPMLATGNSAAAAVARLKQMKPKSIKFMCLLWPSTRRPSTVSSTAMATSFRAWAMLATVSSARNKKHPLSGFAASPSQPSVEGDGQPRCGAALPRCPPTLGHASIRRLALCPRLFALCLPETKKAHWSMSGSMGFLVQAGLVQACGGFNPPDLRTCSGHHRCRRCRPGRSGLLRAARRSGWRR